MIVNTPVYTNFLAHVFFVVLHVSLEGLGGMSINMCLELRWVFTNSRLLWCILWNARFHNRAYIFFSRCVESRTGHPRSVPGSFGRFMCDIGNADCIGWTLDLEMAHHMGSRVGTISIDSLNFIPRCLNFQI